MSTSDSHPAPALNALGEPMPKDQTEALARQLLAELNELATFSTQALAVGERYTGEGDDLDTAYARKRAQLEALGYAVTAGSETGWRLALVEVEQPAPEPAPGSVAYTLTRRQIRVFWCDAADVEQGARLYPRTAKGHAAAERCIARKAAEGYRDVGPQQAGDALSEIAEMIRAEQPAAAPAAEGEYDGCVRCAAPAVLTVHLGTGDYLRLCRGCFHRHYEQNEDCPVSWEVVEPWEAVEPDEPPAELRPLVEAFARAWEARSESLARVARALAPEPLVHTLPAGCRVRVTFGPDAGQVGTVVSGPSPDGYYSVKVDGREPDGWGSLWFFLRHEITHTTVPPAEDRPWANDAAYAAEGQRIG